MNAFRSETSVYYTFTDRDVAPGSLADVQVLDHAVLSIRLHALFFDHIVIPDGASLYNRQLRLLALAPEHQHAELEEFLKSGIIVWSQRNNARTFRDLHQFMLRTGSRNVDMSAQQLEYINYLDDVCSVRAPYDYELTASLFTDLTISCLGDQELMRSLDLDRVAADALVLSERRREETLDGYARRTAAFEYADRLDRYGATRRARRLRQLSSALYHGSAATALGLQLAYPSSYQPVLNALHHLDVPAWAHTGERKALVTAAAEVEDLPFYSEALAVLSFDVISDIRRSGQFRIYTEALRNTASDPDGAEASRKFRDALREYIDYLNGPLAAVLTGRYVEMRRLRRSARLTRVLSVGGSAFIALSSLLVPIAPLVTTTASAVWGFAGWSAARWLHGRSEGVEQAGRRARENLPDVMTVNTSRIERRR